MTYKISVIVPVYNVEKYLSRCLDSICSQTLKDIEIICVNDGSTDNSLSILEEYAEKDDRIKIINKQNGGLSSARNEGMKHACAQYIGFVDSDDWIEPNTYETALYAMEKSNADYVSWGANVALDKGIKETTSILSAKNYHDIKRIGYYELSDEVLAGTTVTVWNKLFKKSVIEQNNLTFPDGLLYEDNEFFYKYCLYCKRAYYIDKYFYNYFQRANSIIGKIDSKKSEKIADYLKIYKNIYSYYESKGLLKEHKLLLSNIFNSFLWNTYTHSADKKFIEQKLQALAETIDNDILQSQTINFVKQGKFYKINNINAAKFALGNSLLGVMNANHKIILRFLGIKLSVKPEKILSVKNENGKKVLKILGLKIKFKKSKKSLTPENKSISSEINANINKNLLKDKLLSDSNNNFTGKKPDFEETIKNHIKDFHNFYFYPNVGNLGDGIIAEAEYQILNNGEYTYKIFDNYDDKPADLTEEFELVYGGGGLFVKYWNYQKVLDIFKNPNLKKCVILPSSFYECDDVLECFDERFTVFCREKNSYNYCISKNKKAKFILADDMAFSLDLDLQKSIEPEKIKENFSKIPDEDFAVIIDTIYPKIHKLYNNVQNALKNNTVINLDGVKIGCFLRTDAEKNSSKSCFPSFDLSIFANSPCTDSGVVGMFSRIFIEALNSVDVIVTDRLHIGLVASLLNKEVYLIDNSYKKVLGIYEYSMQKYNKTHIINSLKEFSIDSIQIKQSEVKYSFINNKLNIEDFLKIYLSKLEYNKKIKDTIWSV